MPSKKGKSKDTRDEGYKIHISKNGPYIVTGGVPLSDMTPVLNKDGDAQGWSETKKYPMQETYSLCRCGQSKNKPFCDGTHDKIGFDGTETAPLGLDIDKFEVTEGPSLKLTDVEFLCSSARFCHRDEGTWDLTERSGDPNARKIAMEEACDCPSGRLLLFDKTNKKPVEPNLVKSIGVTVDPQSGVRGPLWVRGGILIESSDGELYEIRNRVTLCRCGNSAVKPLCDSGHLYL
jgi:CDGSH-type Zn-finger protein